MSPEAKPIIRVKDLIIGYNDNIVLRNVDFEILTGEIFTILGGSGCGKSTLLKHMIGLLQPLGGSVLIDGTDIVTAQGSDRLGVLRKIGVAYQNGALFRIHESDGEPLPGPRRIHRPA